MASDESSEQLLRRIADTVGLDVTTFLAARDGAAPGIGEAGGGSRLLQRLVRVFRSLPDDEDRLQAVELLEQFAARQARGRTPVEPDPTDTGLLN